MKAFEFIRLGIKHRKDPFYVKYLMGRRVLDVGCGYGDFLVKEPDNFVGIDIDPYLISQCHDRKLTAYCMDALDLRFRDESFDVVRAAQLIEHFSPREAARFLNEASRVVRKGGWVYLTTPGVCNIWNTFSHIRPYPPVAFRKLLNTPTENYINEAVMNLEYFNAWGSRKYYNNKMLAFISQAVDLIVTPGTPIGWTILLRKKY